MKATKLLTLGKEAQDALQKTGDPQTVLERLGKVY